MTRAPNFTSKITHTDAKLETTNDIRQVIPSLLPAWTSAQTAVEVVTGGITNRIYKATCKCAVPCAVLVRIFCSGDVFTRAQRKEENIVFEELAEAGIAPTLHAVFGNGRVEQFLNARNIGLGEMVNEDVMLGVARAMARLHAFEPKGVTMDREPGMWKDMQRWAVEIIRLVSEGVLCMPGGLVVEEIVEGLKEVRTEVDMLGSPVVFCHNDLLCGNIMVNKHKQVALVDFEYSSFNYRGFDIGNFFCEAMGGTIDGFVDESRYPSEDARYNFCREYLRNGGRGTDKEVEALVKEAEKFGRASHLYWGLWALIQAVSSTVNFPYQLFAEQRLRLCLKRAEVKHRSQQENPNGQ